MRRKWQEWEMSLLQREYRFADHRRLAERLDRTVAAVRSKWRRMGRVKPKDKGPLLWND